MDNSSYFRFDYDNKTKYIYIYILSNITRGMGKLKTCRPIYCIMTIMRSAIRYDLEAKNTRLFALIINFPVIKKTKCRKVYAISDRIWCNKHLKHTTTEYNMITMGKVDTSDLIMIMTWAVDVSFQSPKLKFAGWTHISPYNVILTAYFCVSKWQSCVDVYMLRDRN